MPVLFQNVRNIFSDVKCQISPYLHGLLFQNNRKTCVSMAHNLKVPLKRLYNSFRNAKSKTKTIRLDLQRIASITSVGEMRVLAIDGTMIRKAFAKKIQNLAFDYDGVLRRATQGLSIIVGSLIIGGNIFPLDFLFWKNSKKGKKRKRPLEDPNHKTKIMLAIEFITSVKNIILFDYIAMDGAFTSEKMIRFLESEKLAYSMRMPRSRRVLINGVLMKLSEHKSLRLVKNEQCKTAEGFYKGHACFFTVEKRKKKNGKWELRYIVSNMKLSAKDHVKAYARRWPIDKSFRSMKQYLGLTDCQMCSENKQAFHIFNVFLAYSIATLKKIASGKNSVEDILNNWRHSNILKKSKSFFENIDLETI